MVHNDVQREVGASEFEYGEHEIEVTTELVHEYRSSSMNASMETGFYRVVTVKAKHDGDMEAINSTAVFLEQELRPSLRDRFEAWRSEQSAEAICRARNGPPIPDLEDQIETTVRPVFDELDYLYEYTNVDYDIDIDASVERVKHDVSWVEIEDEVERLATEIDGLAHASK